MSLEARIKAIKQKNNQAIIEKAKAEERLKHLEEQKAQVVKRCEELGIDPLELDKRIQDETDAIEKLTKEAEELLGITPNKEESF